MVIARQLVDSSVFRATWTLRRSDQPVAHSVPDTQPLAHFRPILELGTRLGGLR